MSAEGKKCRCNEPPTAGPNTTPPPKLALAPGQSSAVYRLEASSAEEIGRLVDQFIANLDFNKVDVSSDFDVSFGISHMRSYQEGTIRTSIGSFSTHIYLTRGGPV